jgi:alkylated DNA nucleotide flippase Atl1
VAIPLRVHVHEVGPRDGLQECGVAEIGLGDTTGMANPAHVGRLRATLRDRFLSARFTLRFHDTRGMGLANILAGLEAGMDALIAVARRVQEVACRKLESRVLAAGEVLDLAAASAAPRRAGSTSSRSPSGARTLHGSPVCRRRTSPRQGDEADRVADALVREGVIRADAARAALEELRRVARADQGRSSK